MRSLRKILIAIVAAVSTSAAFSAPAPVKVDSPGLLVIRNGSDFASLSVTVYRVEGGRESVVKRDTISPETTQIHSLPAGDYLATFGVTNGAAAASEGRFSLGAGEDYTINFQPKGKP